MMSSRRSRANSFAALELDRASERREDAQWIGERQRHADSRFVVLRSDGAALVRNDHGALFEFGADALPDGMAAGCSFLGHDGRHAYFLVVDEEGRAAAAAGEGAVFLDLRRAGALLPAFPAGLFAYARGLALWQARTRFCSTCGAPLALEAAGHRAKCTNPQCGTAHFPRTDPAIIVIVGDGDRCLLGRQPSWPERRYSTLAGFVEPGESLEDAVRREVFEETGVRVGDCDYHSSQPWPFPASIMLGFTATAEDPRISIGSELAEARWFSADELVSGLTSRELGVSSPMSVSYRLIEHWLRGVAGVELSAIAQDDPVFARPR